MRLKLVVQRHSLPPVQLLWTVAGPIRPPYADAGSSFTISQLLEQINEIIPLESEEWGLEDYAVEVGGFECLHFSEISHVLKEDDIVCVRPLQTTDIRFRKISGRHQISADGKHLFDGVAFGRPFLQLASRPPIRIPPRKKRRIAYDEDDDDGVYSPDSRQLALEERPEDDDNQDDEESLPDEDEDQGLSDELEDIFNDNDAQVTTPEQMMDIDRLKNLPRRITRSTGNKGLGIHGATGLSLGEGISTAHQREYPSALLERPVGEERPRPSNKRKIKRRKGDRDGLRAQEQTALQLYEEAPEISGATVRSSRLGEIDSTTPATIRDFEGSDRSSDEDFEPGNNNMEDTDESDKENSQPREALAPRLSPSNSTSSSSSQSSETDQDDTTSSSESSPTDDSSDSEPERLPSNSGHQSLPSDISSSSGSSSSDSDSRTEKSPDKIDENAAGSLQNSRICAAHNLKSLAAAKKSVPFSKKTITLPFKGKKQTQLRNQRRRQKKKAVKERLSLLQRLNGDNIDKDEVEKPIASPKIGVIGLHVHPHRLSNTSLVDVLSPNPSRKGASAVTIEEAAMNIGETTIETMGNDLLNGQSLELQDFGYSTSQTSTSAMAKKVESAAKNAKTPERRSKLDLASSRRMLFGSLGVRTPKTKEDETETREKLMKGFRPMKEPGFQGVAEANELLPVEGSEENESWADKIILKAVECCHEGIELKTPPFPFVQRWDPQQQGGYKGFGGGRSRKNKKRKRNNSQFYAPDFSHEAEYGQLLERDQPPSGVEDPKGEDAIASAEKQQPATEDQGIDVHVVQSNSKSTKESDASAKDSSVGTNSEDLPMLSEDMSTCVSLAVELSLPGAIIAFKQLDMSEKTNWQPKVSEYRTATVDHLMDNGMLRMTLAQRDRSQKQIQRSNERIYSKFEMPGLNEEEACEDGVIELSFAELIEPKLIRPASTESRTTGQLLDQQCSIRGGNLTSESNVDIVESIDQSHIFPHLSNANLPVVSTDINSADNGREGIRKEIFSIIKDAGWRSSIGSIIGSEEVFNEHEASIDKTKEKDEQSLTLNSPKFSASKSGHPIAERAETGPEKQTFQADPTIENEENSDFPVSPSFPGFGSSPPIARRLEAKAQKQNSQPEMIDKDASTFPNPPNFPSFSSSLLGAAGKKEELTQQSDGLESVPASPCHDVTEGFTEPKSFSERPSNLGNEDFGQHVDKNLGWNEPPLLSDVMEADHQISSQELAPRGSPSESPPRVDLKNELLPQADSSSDSDSEFPSLEDVFSVFRSPHGTKHVGTSSFETEVSEAPASTQPVRKVRREEPAPFASQPARKVKKEGSVPVSSLPARKAKPEVKNKLAAKQTVSTWPESEGYDQTTQASKAAKKPQIVDLTLSSDDPPDDDDFVDYATQLPTGPGWVRKSRASARGTAASKRGRGRLTKTKST